MNTTMKNHLKAARFLATFLDNQFSIGSFKFGIGPIIGLIPGIGDIIENALSFYLIWIALKADIPNAKLAKMFSNIGFNFFLALIPVLGDIGDFAFKSNIRNLKILEEFLEQPIIDGEIIIDNKLENMSTK